MNRQTHAHTPAHPARLRGWHRAWRAVPERALCYLTAVKDPDAAIDGLIAPVPGTSWEELDKREAAYERHDASSSLSHESTAREIVVYAINPTRTQSPGPENPILLSYLDVVVAGYLTEYGDKGPETFFESTLGWQAPILDDRAAPRYSRSLPLTEEVRHHTDSGLLAVGSRIITSEG